MVPEWNSQYIQYKVRYDIRFGENSLGGGKTAGGDMGAIAIADKGSCPLPSLKRSTELGLRAILGHRSIPPPSPLLVGDILLHPR